MSDRPKWIEGETYTYAEISQYTFPENRGRPKPPPDTLFTYSKDEYGTGFFDGVVENPNPLVSGMASQIAVSSMRAHGMTFRQIARVSGVSIEAVHRAGSGVGNVRESTERALLQVSGALNGNGRVR